MIMPQPSLEEKMRWLFDTNSIIQLIRRENAVVYEKLKKLKIVNYVSKITVLEFPKSFKTYKNFQIIDLNQKISDKALELVIKLRMDGQIIPIPDVLIMASAEVHEIPLIISDDKHFHIMRKYTESTKIVISFQDFIQKLLS